MKKEYYKTIYMSYLSDEDIQSAGIAMGKCIKNMFKVIQLSWQFVILKTKAYFHKHTSQERKLRNSSRGQHVIHLYNAYGTSQYYSNVASKL